MNKLVVLTAALAFTLMVSCVSNNEEDLPKNLGGCDSLSVTYTKDISVMISSSTCLSCHSAQTANGGIILETYHDVSGHAEKMLTSLSWLPNEPAARYMPPGGPKFSECNISKIRAWIAAGKPE